VLYTLGYAGKDPEVLNDARRRVEMQFSNAGNIDPSLMVTYLNLAALNGDQALYDKYLTQISRTTQTRQEQLRTALTYFADPALQRRTMEYALSDQVRSQDFPYILAGLLSRPWSAHPAWEFVQANWSTLESRLGVFQGLPAVIGATGAFCDQPTRDELQRFFGARRVRAIDRQTRQALEQVDSCIRTRNQQAASLNAFLKTN